MQKWTILSYEKYKKNLHDRRTYLSVSKTRARSAVAVSCVAANSYFSFIDFSERLNYCNRIILTVILTERLWPWPGRETSRRRSASLPVASRARGLQTENQTNQNWQSSLGPENRCQSTDSQKCNVRCDSFTNYNNYRSIKSTQYLNVHSHYSNCMTCNFQIRDVQDYIYIYMYVNKKKKLFFRIFSPESVYQLPRWVALLVNAISRG